MRSTPTLPDVEFAIRERARFADDVLSWLRVLAVVALVATLPLVPDRLATQPTAILTVAFAAVTYSVAVAVVKPHRRWPTAAALFVTTADAAFTTLGILFTGGIASPYAGVPVVAVVAASFRFGPRGTIWLMLSHLAIPVALAAVAGFSAPALAYLAITVPLMVFLGTFLALVSQRLLPAQGEVHARQERFQLAIAGSNDGIWDWNLKTGDVYFSPRAKEILGYRDDEFASSWTAWEAAVHPDDRKPVMRAVDAHLRHGTPLAEMEYRLRHRDGSWRWVLSRGTSAAGPDGRPVRLAGSITDVTARQEAEQKLVELKQLHEDMVEHVPAGVVYLDALGHINYENRFLLTMLGAKPDEPPRGWLDNILDLDTVRERPEFATRIEALLAGVAFQDYEFEYRSLYGRDLVLSVSGVPVEGADESRPRGALLLVRDVTEARRAERERELAAERLREIERLEEMNRFKTQILNTASHELNTPLTPLRLQLHLLQSGALGALNERQGKSVSILDRNLNRLSALVADVLDVARIQAGRLRLRPEPLDLAALVDTAAEAFEEPARGRRLTLRVDAHGPLPVTGDASRLTQVVFNLITNALRYTPDGGRVEVHAAQAGERAVVRVRDTGRGLRPEQIERLFQPFSQVHDDATGGTGLGLYISRGILAEHGGSIVCESDGPGAGSTFRFELPLAKAVAAAAPLARAP